MEGANVVARGGHAESGPDYVKLDINNSASHETTQKSGASVPAAFQGSSIIYTSTIIGNARGSPSDPEYFGYSADSLKPPGLDLNDVCPCNLRGHLCLHPEG